MIDELNVDWATLTKADMYTIIKQTEEQNAKLRELVRDMCEWAYIDSCCDLQSEFADRMRELGIEVNG